MPDFPSTPNRETLKKLEGLSPFELRERLLNTAGEEQQLVGRPLLNAGRGNPNFLATTPRDAFFQLGLFSVDDSRAAGQWTTDLVAQPAKPGIAARLAEWSASRADQPGIAFLATVVEWATQQGWDADAFVWELVDAILGNHYVSPPAMLNYCSEIGKRYIGSIMGEGFPEPDAVDIFATEGGTAAMRYIFDTLFANRLLAPGDSIAIMAPVFTPYLNIADLPMYGLNKVLVEADGTFPNGSHSWQFSDEQIDKLRDPSIKLLVCINPTNPPSVRIADKTIARIEKIVHEDNPNLIIITDDVYSTFIDGFRSLSAVVPQNTILVYSYSKYFGATGWRLGVITTARDTVLDKLLAELPDETKEILRARYASLTDDADSLTFAQRLVADSRDVALNHTAGISGPQQVQLALFSLFDILDTEKSYRKAAQGLVADRLNALLEGLDSTLTPDPLRTGYYIEIDFLSFAKRHYPTEFVEFLEKTYEPADVLFRLAAQAETVALNGSGFDGPPWSIRLSLANLNAEDYRTIGKAIRKVAEEYVAEWKASV
jgi:aspartate 4-decarboxylase